MFQERERRISRRQFIVRAAAAGVGGVLTAWGISETIVIASEAAPILARRAERILAEQKRRFLPEMIQPEERREIPGERIVTMLTRPKDEYPRLAFVWMVGPKEFLELGSITTIKETLPNDGKVAVFGMGEIVTVSPSCLKILPLEKMSKGITTVSQVLKAKLEQPLSSEGEIFIDWQGERKGTIGILSIQPKEEAWTWGLSYVFRIGEDEYLKDWFLKTQGVLEIDQDRLVDTGAVTSEAVQLEKGMIPPSGLLIRKIGERGDTEILGIFLKREASYWFVPFDPVSGKEVVPQNEQTFASEYFVKLVVEKDALSVTTLSLLPQYQAGKPEPLSVLHEMIIGGEDQTVLRSALGARVLRRGVLPINHLFGVRKGEVVFTSQKP